MRPSGIEPDLPRWQRDVLTGILWPHTLEEEWSYLKVTSGAIPA